MLQCRPMEPLLCHFTRGDRGLLRSLACLPVVAGLLLGCVGTPVARAQTSAAVALQYKQPTATTSPVLRNHRHDSRNQIYALDKHGLGDRIPVIILPGRVQENQRNPWWKKLHQQARKNTEIQQRYGWYLFLYDSWAELPDLKRDFQVALQRLLDSLPDNRPVVLVSYSLGGVIAQHTLLDPANEGLLERVHSVFGLAVPYAGSPIFDPSWYQSGVKHPSPVRRLWDWGLYRFYMADKSNLVRAMRWQNVDASQPEQWQHLTTKAYGPLLPPPDNPKALALLKSKTVVYASYLPVASPVKPHKRLVGLVLKLPSWVLPLYLTNVHGAMEHASPQLARLSVTPQTAPHPFRYNDGVIPLSSALFLPSRSLPYTEPPDALAHFAHRANLCYVRLFKGLDHVDLGHYRWPTGSLKQPDAQHPQAGRYKPIQWLFEDLKQMAQATQAHPWPNEPNCQITRFAR
ncbi:MAG: hypothetical protein SFZ03_06760 [Candidatus Melainabacteria bacterium]|nr:hypothetical protein [Candidatus Melainabacteria bacterium]